MQNIFLSIVYGTANKQVYMMNKEIFWKNVSLLFFN